MFRCCALRRMLSTTSAPVMDRRLVKLTYSRSQGPGGQHVNTTSSRVDARFNLTHCEITKSDELLRDAIKKTFPQYVSKSEMSLSRLKEREVSRVTWTTAWINFSTL